MNSSADNSLDPDRGAPSSAESRAALLFAGVPAEGTSARSGPITGEAAYREAWRAGEAILGRALTETPADRDLAATLHGCAAFSALEARGLVAARDLLAAHSLGLYAALFAAGSLDLAGALAIAEEAARGIADAGASLPSGLAAIVGLPLERIRALANDHGCAVANLNSGQQAVVGGTSAALARLCEAARAAGALDVRRIDAQAAIHTPFACAAAARVEALLGMEAAEGTGLPGSALVPVREPSRPVCSGLEPRWIRSAADARKALSRNLSSPIDWPATVTALRAAGATRLLDLGPGDALGRLARFIDRDVASIALDGTRDAAAARKFLARRGAA